MQGIYKHYIIDMSCNNNFVQVPTVQGDGNNVRGFEVELIANNIQYVVDASSTGVYIAGTKPDTKQILNSCTITSEGYILVDITQQMAAVAGRGDYSIVLIDLNTNSQLKSFPFYILTTASAYSASDIVSSNEFQALANSLTDVKRVESEIKTAESERVAAELNRKEAEIQRENATQNAINAANIATENANIAANNANQINELISIAEEQRVAAEQKRESDTATTLSNLEQATNNANEEIDKLITLNETVTSAEAAREIAETDREDAEAIRKANEIIRQEQEVQRQTNTATAITNAENATSFATTQGNYAKEQGDYAKAATANANAVADDLEAKRDAGYFNGKDGVITEMSGMFVLNINDIGHLILTYDTLDDSPNLSINSSGHLLYIFS